MFELFVVVILLGGAWLWLENQGAREQAISIAKDFCVKENVQFLDGAMALVRMRLQRNTQGRMAIARTYQFEFSDTGDNRLKGAIMMLGRKLETLHLQPYRLSVEPNRTLH